MRTLVLNAGFEPVQLVSWQKALCLVLTAKAEVIAEYGHVVRTVSTVFPLPSIVRLKRWVRVVQRLALVRCTRKNVLLRDRHQCQYCGVQCRPGTITIDHIVPLSRGGRTVWENVVAACHTCNRRKGDQTPERVGLKLSRQPRRPGWRELLEETSEEIITDWLPYLEPTG
jgi:5-methylcytosine-specific restriction endonuclease McrA